MTEADKLSMKAFWEAVEHRLAECDRDALCSILRTMARETPPSERRVFLDVLFRVEDTRAVAERALRQDELLADIEDLAQEIRHTLENAEPWLERTGWYEYDDEDGTGLYSEFIEPLSVLFDRAEAAFDYGHLALARAAYRELFEIVEQEDDYGCVIGFSRLVGVDVGETCARYLCAIYESESLERRPEVLYANMRLVRIGLRRRRPTLDDLVQISPHPLPEWDRFLVGWIAFLRTREEADADRLLREAIRLSQGTPGLEALARSEGLRRPMAYLDWCAALEEEGKPQAVLLAAQEALQALPADLSVRASIADHLCVAAARLGEREALRAGRWEAFRVQPRLERVLDLRDTGTESQGRTALMKQTGQYARRHLVRPSDKRTAVEWDWDGNQRWIQPTTLAHVYLLAGEFDAARRLVQEQEVLGWSSSSSAQGMVVAFLLVWLSHRTFDELPPNLARVWQWGMEYSAGSWIDQDEELALARLERAYTEQLSRTPESGYRAQSALSWCLGVVQRRVNAIVSAQHRGAYDRAAVLMVACAETIELRGDQATADALVEEIRTRFPRHSAFQRELGKALQRKRS
jgi:hypothetical protein